MGPKYGFPLLFIIILAIVLSAQADTAPLGGTKTYLPLTQRGNGYALPNGNLLLYTLGYQSEANIFLSPPPPATPIELTTTIGSTNPRFSPDGQYLLYSDDFNAEGTRLRVMGANGTPNFSLIEVVDEYMLGQVRWGPDSRTLAYRYTDQGSSTLRVITLDNPSPCVIVNGSVSSPIWDTTAMRLYYDKATGIGSNQEIRRINADGTDDALVTPADGQISLYGQLAGGQLLFRVYTDVIDDLYLVNPDGTHLIRLTNEPEYEAWISVSPRGDRIFFQREATLYLIDLDGTVVWSRPRSCPDGCRLAQSSWSPDGEELSFTFISQVGTGSSFYLYQLATDGSQGEPTILYDGPSAEHGYSPDGRYFAYEAEGEIRVLDRTTQTTTSLTSPQSGGGVYFYGWRPLP